RATTSGASRTMRPYPTALADRADVAKAHLAPGGNVVGMRWYCRAMKFTLMILFASLAVAADVPPVEVQIAGAVLAAPAELRDGAAVIGYNPQGAQVKIREGKNEMICLASDPAKTAFNVACYHRDLEPFMARGRELLAQ